MIDNWIRERLPGYTKGLLSFYKKLGLTPNGVTWLGFFLASASALLIAKGLLFSALCVWWVGRIADGTDGIYARELGVSSQFGAYLDIVLDMAGYSVMIIGFYWQFPDLVVLWGGILFLYVLCIASALALGQGQAVMGSKARDNRGLRLGAGLAEAGETGIAYSLFLVFPQYLPYLACIWVAVLFVTVVARTILASRVLR